MSTLTRPLTYDDLATMPDDGKRYELIGGRLFELTSPLRVHVLLARRIFLLLYEFATSHGLGEVLSAPADVVLSPENVVQPDVLFITGDRFDIYNRAYIGGPPDLVVEILSPSTSGRDRTVKAELYARFGVREYWMVDPVRKSLSIQVLGTSGYETTPEENGRVRSNVLPGLVVAVAALFAGIE